MPLPRSWKPVRTRGLTLIGPRGDGGYVTTEAALADVDVLISFGLGDDWGFEEDFRTRTGARVDVYDHTVGWHWWPYYTLRSLYRRHFRLLTKPLSYARFIARRGVTHHRRAVGSGEGGTVSLAQIVADLPDDASLFLKMDIEGAEYSVLDDIVTHRHRFTGMAMEFHEVGRHRARIEAFVAALEGFAVVAAYPNNAYPADAAGDPRLLEMSFVRKDFLDPDAAAEPIAMPQTIAGNPPITLTFA